MKQSNLLTTLKLKTYIDIVYAVLCFSLIVVDARFIIVTALPYYGLTEKASLKDRSLRTALITYYQNTKLASDKGVEDDKREFWDVILPYIRRHFKAWFFDQYGIPNDYKKLQADEYFLASLKTNLVNCQGTTSRLETGMESIKSLIKQLDI